MFEHILIVAENTKLRHLLYDVISSKSFKVTTLPSGNEAINLLASQRPELIIIDKDMPHMPGEDLVNRIRAFDKDVKIAMLVDAATAEEKKDEIMRLDISLVIRKDFSDPDMLRDVFKILKEPGIGELAKKHKGEILIVDDDAQTREVLVNFLMKRGYQVSQAGNGEDAINKINIKPPPSLFF